MNRNVSREDRDGRIEYSTNISIVFLSVSQYLDRCSRFEKALDSRLKEVRFLQASSEEDPVPHLQETKAKARKKDSKEKKKEKRVSVVKEKRDSRKKSKGQKPKGKSSVRSSSPGLTQVEINYFEKVDEVK